MLLGALDERVLRLAGRRDAGQIALDVGGEHRHAGAREAFGQHLQRDRLAGAGRAGHQAVAIAVVQRQIFGLLALADEDLAVLIEIRHRASPARSPRDANDLCYHALVIVRAAWLATSHSARRRTLVSSPVTLANDCAAMRMHDLDARGISCLCFARAVLKIIATCRQRGT